MHPVIDSKRRAPWFWIGAVSLLSALMMVGPGPAHAYLKIGGEEVSQRTFPSPGDAAMALLAAAKTGDKAQGRSVLGPEGERLLSSGDSVEDRNARERFVRLFEEKNQLVQKDLNRVVLEIGKDAWPFPIPIVGAEGEWRFDTPAGIEEILNRRIGKNELSAIQVCLAHVEAQREYAAVDRDGDGILEYAQKLMSSPGKKDGLYWTVTDGEESSPLGPLAARAKEEGYGRRKTGSGPSPYHGYYYKILMSQGKHTPGGQRNYVVKGDMTGGFAMVAYPAEYGASGIMTFLVSADGIVYEKDLGSKTSSIARAMKSYDPDASWKKVKTGDLELSGKSERQD